MNALAILISGFFCATGLVMALPHDHGRLTIVHSSASFQPVLKAKVKMIAAENTGKDPVYGTLTLIQTSKGVYIQGKILGLEAGKHGFHVHEIGDLGNDCKNSKGHFNPKMRNHGKPENRDERHVGDLGNIEAKEDHFLTQVSIFDDLISLSEDSENSILGRAFVVHAEEDDLGMGGNAGSLKTGNAGSRLSCGIVESVNF